ncbi:MAG: FecR family protein [candidate division WOR-3 bacterium]
MIKIHWKILLIFLSILLVQSAEIPAQLTFMVGDVEVTRNNVVSKAQLNMNLLVGDVIQTKAESYGEIKFANQSLVRLEPNSSLKIEQKEETKSRKVTRLFVMLGEIVNKVTKMAKRDVYEVRTNSAQAFVRGTIFKLKVEEDGSSLFSVFEGKLGVKSLVAGAREMLMDKDFQGKITVGQLAPVIERISPQELLKFKQQFKDFLERSAQFEKAIKELEDQIEKNKYYQKAKKSCLFF